jgi:hypothetical protein
MSNTPLQVELQKSLPTEIDLEKFYSAARQGILIAVRTIPSVGAALSKVMELLWPGPHEDVWPRIREQSERLVNQRLAEEKVKAVKESLLGIRANMNDYLRAAAVGSNQTDIHWHTTLSQFRQHEDTFRSEGYELLLLPVFTQMANLYLLLLRDGGLHGREWGWDPAHQAEMIASLREKISVFTQYAHNTAQAGLAERRASFQRRDHGPRNPAQRYEYALGWSLYNEYLQELTHSVLDFQALWPYMDVVAYPEGGNPVFKRQLYTPATGGSYTPIAPPAWRSEALGRIRVWAGDRIDAIEAVNGDVSTGRMGSPTGGTLSPPAGADLATPKTTRVIGYAPPGRIVPIELRTETIKVPDVLWGLQLEFSTGARSPLLGVQYQPTAVEAFSYGYPDHMLATVRVMGADGDYGSANCAVFGFRREDSFQLSEALWVYHQAPGRTGWMRLAVLSGTTWLDDDAVPGVGMSESPSTVLFRNQVDRSELLYCFHQGFGANGELWYFRHDGRRRSASLRLEGTGLTGSPAAVASHSRLYCFHQGRGGSGELRYDWFDGAHWTVDQQVPGVRLQGSPLAFAYRESPFCFFREPGAAGTWKYINFSTAGGAGPIASFVVPNASFVVPVAYAGKAWAFYGEGDGRLKYLQLFAAEQRMEVPEVRTDRPPAFGILHDRLFCVYHPDPGSDRLSYTFWDGRVWVPSADIPDAVGAETPAVIGFHHF